MPTTRPRLAVLALLHTTFAQATEELLRDVPRRQVRWDDKGGTYVGLTDNRGRFGPDNLVTNALRTLDGSTRRRRVLTGEHLAEVARIYLAAVEAGNRYPTQAVADAFGRPRQTAATWVMRARSKEVGLIPPIEKRGN